MKSLHTKHMEDYEMDVPTKEQQEAKALNYLAEENASLKRSHAELLEAARNVYRLYRGEFDSKRRSIVDKLGDAIEASTEKVQK